jgi:hypothetical protein
MAKPVRRRKVATKTTARKKQRTVSLTKKLEEELRAVRALRKKKYQLEIGGAMAKEIIGSAMLTVVFLTYLSTRGAAGTIGSYWHQFLSYILGYYGEMFFMFFFSVLAITFFFSKEIRFNFTRIVGIIFLFASVLGFIHLSDTLGGDALARVQQFGGVFGFISSFLLKSMIGEVAAKAVLGLVFVISLLITFDITLKEMLQGLRELVVEQKREEVKAALRSKDGLVEKKGREKGGVRIVEPEKPLPPAEEINIIKPDFVTSKVEKKGRKTNPVEELPVLASVLSEEEIQQELNEDELQVVGPKPVRRKPEDMMQTVLQPGLDWKFPSLDLSLMIKY